MWILTAPDSYNVSNNSSVQTELRRLKTTLLIIIVIIIMQAVQKVSTEVIPLCSVRGFWLLQRVFNTHADEGASKQPSDCCFRRVQFLTDMQHTFSQTMHRIFWIGFNALCAHSRSEFTSTR